MQGTMRRLFYYFIPLVVVVIVIAVLGLGLHNGNPTLVPSPLINRPAPDFRVTRVMAPHKHFGKATLMGHVSLLNVWASWCVSCKEEHPVLLALAQDPGVMLYGLDYKDTRAAAQAWLERAGNPYRAIGFDPHGSVGFNFGVYGVPETYVIDARGVIRRKFIGPLTPYLVSHTLLPLIRELKRQGTTKP